MEKNIILVGSVPYANLPALYQYASVNIFASEVENCPNILLEMMASGRPAVVSNRPPMPEIGGDAVCYFDPSRPEDLAERLRELMKDRAQREFLGEKALERSRMYNWENSARLTWQAIASLAT
jgi:glycosyltransferase involved in cell wall biosynthesis